MTPEEQIKHEEELAVQGQLLKNNKLFQDIIAIRRAEVFSSFCDSNGDTEVMLEAWRTMKNLDSLMDGIEEVLDTGKMNPIKLKSITETDD